jgi:hypothetical protein
LGTRCPEAETTTEMEVKEREKVKELVRENGGYVDRPLGNRRDINCRLVSHSVHREPNLCRKEIIIPRISLTYENL